MNFGKSLASLIRAQVLGLPAPNKDLTSNVPVRLTCMESDVNSRGAVHADQIHVKMAVHVRNIHRLALTSASVVRDSLEISVKLQVTLVDQTLVSTEENASAILGHLLSSPNVNAPFTTMDGIARSRPSDSHSVPTWLFHLLIRILMTSRSYFPPTSEMHSLFTTLESKLEEDLTLWRFS